MTSVSFDTMSPEHDVANALRLAHAANVAYKDEAEVERQAREWGFDDFRHFRVEHKQPFPLEDTQAYAIAKDNMIILAFRGTEPAEIRDWLSDANAPLVPVTNGMAHWGFHTALDAVYEPTREAVTELRDRDQSVWLTGHSLGGALAMLAAARLHFEEPSLSADGVYTYGQPRTCDSALADAYDEALAGRTFRFVNNNDIVPRVPPEPVYRHVAVEKYIAADGTLGGQSSFFGKFGDSVKGHTADVFSPGTDAVRDHSMKNYIAHLTKAVG